jgi:hypothetical protein
VSGVESDGYALDDSVEECLIFSQFILGARPDKVYIIKEAKVEFRMDAESGACSLIKGQ